MQSNFDIVVIGGNADGLTLASSFAQMGKKTALLDANMKVGGELLTESFLTSHRFNLSGGWLLADSLAQIEVQDFSENNKRFLYPTIPMAFVFDDREPLIFYRKLSQLQSQITQADRKKWLRFMDAGDALYASVHGCFSENKDVKPGAFASLSDKTVKQTLDAFEFKDKHLRCALTYLPLALGYDIETPGSGAALAFLVHGLSRLSVVDGGAGLLVNSLTDNMVSRGGMIFESSMVKEISNKKGKLKSILLEDGRVLTAPVIVHAKEDTYFEKTSKKAPAARKYEEQLGVYRIYLDFKHSPTGFLTSRGNDELLRQAYMVSFGFNTEEDIYHYLKMIKVGQPPFIAGHVLNNSFLDVKSPIGALGNQQTGLWCTSCHTTDARQLRQLAGNTTSPQKASSMQTKMLESEAFSTVDKEISEQLGLSRNQTTGNYVDARKSGVKIRPVPGSLIWQGILPQQLRTLDVEGFRKSFERACVEKITQSITGIEQEDVRFQLTWLGNETREPLLQINLIEMLLNKEMDKGYMTENAGIYIDPYAKLSRYTGMRTGQKLVSVLKNRLAEE